MLPRYNQNNKQKGFTLIELLVVIAILAILAIIAATLYTGVQSRARDAKRKADITAMSRAMESNYVVGTGYPTTVQGSWFADQVIPSNPTPGGAAYATNTITTATFMFCATLEGSTGNATASTGTGLGTTSVGGFFCKRNSQ